MKIAMVVPTLGFRGGIERYAFDTAASLRARGHEVWLVHGRAQGRDADAYVTGFDGVASLEGGGASARAIRDMDVAYVQKATDVADVAALSATGRARMPMVFAVHDHDLTCPRAHRYVPLGHRPCHAAAGLGCVANGCVVTRTREPGVFPLRVVNPFEFRPRLEALARRGPLVTCSAYVKARVIDAGVAPARVHVIYPIAPEHTTGHAPTPAPSAPRIAYVGQLIRGKGVDLAIRALAMLPAEVQLTIAGEGSMESELRDLAARVGGGRVEFCGYVTPERTRAIYDEAKVVVVPSRWPEPFGMVGVEAMRRGRVVVGARHGGIPEWLAPEGRGGRGFEPGDVADLARAIRLALADQDGGPGAAKHVCETFPVEKSIGAIERVLEAETSESAQCR